MITLRKDGIWRVASSGVGVSRTDLLFLVRLMPTPYPVM